MDRRLLTLHTAVARATVASYLRMLVRADLQAHGMLPSVPYPTPPEPTVLRVAEPARARYGSATEPTQQSPVPRERVVELDGAVGTPPEPPAKPKRQRR